MKLSDVSQLSERTRDYLMVIPCGIIFFGLWPFTGQGKAFVAGLTFGLFYVLISRCWDKKSDARFWAIIGILALIHIVALWAIKFPVLRAGMIAFPFVLVDGLFMYGIISWLAPGEPKSRS